MFDLHSAYHQVLVKILIKHHLYALVECTNFGRCHLDFAMLVLRFSVSWMSGLHFQVCLVYLDDIIVFSETIEQHLERLETILK